MLIPQELQLSRFSESTNIVLNHIREMKYSSMIFVVKQ